MRLPSNPAPIRSQKEVRAAVDEALGAGVGLSIEEAAARLGHVERVEWLLGELLFSLLDHGLHRWVQGFASPGGFDGPRHLAALIEAGRAIDPALTDLLRWVVERGRMDRDGLSGVALITPIPEVALGGWEGVPSWVRRMVEGWPAEVDPLALPEAAPFSRTTTHAQPGTTHFPSVAIGFTGAGAACAVQCKAELGAVRETVLHALFRAGADDEALDGCFQMLGSADRQLPERLAEWVLFDGDGGDAARFEALRVELFPRSALERLLGRDALPFPALALLPLEALEPFREAVRGEGAVDLTPRDGRDLLQMARAALRQDPDLVFVASSHLVEGASELLTQTLLTGHQVVLFGESAATAALEQQLVGFGVPVLRPA